MKKSTKMLGLIIAGLFLVSLISNGYFYLKYKHARDSDPNIQTQQIVASLQRTVDVPDETPSVLTVVDKSKLKDSQIAEKAENGDKILLFQKAGEVYIYRPSTDKLINILNITNSASQPASSPAGTSQSASPAATSPTKATTKR